MAGILAGLKGRFILSINDMPEMRDVFGQFNIKPVELKYTASSGPQTAGKELLISNFEKL